MKFRRAFIILVLITMCCNMIVDCWKRKENTHSESDVGGQPINFYLDYHRLGEIHKYMNAIAKNGSAITRVFSIGTSVEGRQLKVIKIGSNLQQRRPSIWIDGGIHAREWISPMTVIYVADRLVNDYSKNKDLIDDIHWYILPVANPDGYEFTHDNPNNRFWRKNRNPMNHTCPGVDLNRNWNFHWNDTGASQDACSEIYAGTAPFSEPETRAMAEFILAKKRQKKFVAYLSFHSFGQVWLTPWGWTKHQATDYDDIKEVAEMAINALTNVSGTKYAIQSSSENAGIAPGGSDDWAKGVAGIKYSYTVELPDNGRYGFALPAKEIEVVTRETWQAIKAFARTILKKNKVQDYRK